MLHIGHIGNVCYISDIAHKKEMVWKRYRTDLPYAGSMSRDQIEYKQTVRVRLVVVVGKVT